METWVYRLRSHGRRLPDEQVIALGPDHGELRFRRRVSGAQIMLAQLMLPDHSYVIPPLDRARLVAIDEDGMLLTGEEVIQPRRSIKSKATWYRQSWWCEFSASPIPRKLHKKALGRPSFFSDFTSDSASKPHNNTADGNE